MKENKEVTKAVESLTAIKSIKGVAMAEFGSPTTNPWTDAYRAKDKKMDYADSFIEPSL
jgi:hypothetical protein